MTFEAFCKLYRYEFSSQANRACMTHQLARQHFKAHKAGKAFVPKYQRERIQSHQDWLKSLEASK